MKNYFLGLPNQGCTKKRKINEDDESIIEKIVSFAEELIEYTCCVIFITLCFSKNLNKKITMTVAFAARRRV